VAQTSPWAFHMPMAWFELLLWMLQEYEGTVWTPDGDKLGRYWGWIGERYVYWRKCNLRLVCKGWRQNHDQAQSVLRLLDRFIDPRGLNEWVPVRIPPVIPPSNAPANIILVCNKVEEVDAA
jgi:hypothetical protein